MSAPAPASALGLPPDSRPATGSSFRRFGRSTSNNHHNNTTTHSQTYLSRQPSTANSYRSNRNPLSGRWFSPTSQSSNNPHFSSVGGTLPIPCAQPDQSSVISRYRQAFFGCYRDIGVDLRASSPDSLVSISDDSEGEGEAETQGTMARLRRPRTSSQASSRTPDPSQRPETQEMPRPEHSNRSSSSRPDSSSRVQAESPAPADPTPVENMTTPEITSTPENTETPSGPKQNATIRFYPHQDLQRNTRPSLQFIPVSRTLPSENSAIRVGRYSERDGVSVANPSAPSSAPIGFKSKVVSRRHCEFLFLNGQWHVKDVGSSSGTFLNHMRLSQPNMVSRLYPIKDGDIVQLGIDFRGGEEMIFRCVRMRVECNRSWQQQPNEFNKNTESLIKNLGKGDTADYSGCRECSICLGSVLRPYQCLFMAACAHVWHYKCVSPLIHSPEYPMFQCPNCRAYTDLSAEVDDSNDYEDKEVRESSHEDQATPEEPRSEHEEHQENQENQETQEPQEPQDEPNAPAAPGTGALLSELGTPQPEREQSDRGEPPAPEASRPPSQGLETEAQQPSTNGTNSFEERRPPAAQGSISHPELPLRMTTLSSPSLDEALAISFEGLHLHRTRTATETEDSPNPPEAPSTNGDVPSHSHLDVPGWQSISPHVRQALHRSDTPVRSESSEETNPLTPRNDSGPLAFDGRAGMP